MNRKLHNTVTALVATTGLLVLGLMAAHPAAVPAPASFDAQMAAVQQDRHSAAAAERIEARAKELEARLAATKNGADALGEIAGFAAEAATLAAIAAAYDQAEALDAAAVETPKPPRKRARRATVAMPYFSFAPRG